MKKLFLLVLAIAGMFTANADEKTVLYQYPFATTESHEYPSVGTYTQNNYLELNGVGNVNTTLTAYDDGTYKIAAWCGVEGYDLDFSISEEGVIEILNEDAERKTSGKGYVYWKVPTGLTVYDRIQIFADNTPTSIQVSETQATVKLAYNSYIYEVGNTGNASVKATYYGRGFAATPVKYTISEAVWDDDTEAYVTTYDLNTRKNALVNVYPLGENSYVATDWLGENTGDLYFSVTEADSILVNDIKDLSGSNNFYNYYDRNLEADCINTIWGGTYNDGTCFGLAVWYGTEADDPESYIYRNIFIEPLTVASVLGTWYENSTFVYYEGADNVQEDNPVTITQVEDNTVTISNLLCNETYGVLGDITGTVDIEAGTLTIEPQTAMWWNYEWGVAATSGENDALVAKFSDDFQTLDLSGLNLYYDGWSYLDKSDIVLTRTKQQEVVLDESPVDELCGDWYDNGSFDYYSTEISISNAPVTIARTGETTVTVKGLFCDPAYPSYAMGKVVADVDLEAKTITIAPQEVSWYGYSWDLANISGTGDSIVGTISDDLQTIVINDMANYYNDSSAQTHSEQTLTRESVATAIKNVNAASEGATYNINGVRMNSNNLPKGVYIVNGKKVIK